MSVPAQGANQEQTLHLFVFPGLVNKLCFYSTEVQIPPWQYCFHGAVGKPTAKEWLRL